MLKKDLDDERVRAWVRTRAEERAKKSSEKPERVDYWGRGLGFFGAVLSLFTLIYGECKDSRKEAAEARRLYANCFALADTMTSIYSYALNTDVQPSKVKQAYANVVKLGDGIMRDLTLMEPLESYAPEREYSWRMDGAEPLVKRIQLKHGSKAALIFQATFQLGMINLNVEPHVYKQDKKSGARFELAPRIKNEETMNGFRYASNLLNKNLASLEIRSRLTAEPLFGEPTETSTSRLNSRELKVSEFDAQMTAIREEILKNFVIEPDSAARPTAR